MVDNRTGTNTLPNSGLPVAIHAGLGYQLNTPLIVKAEAGRSFSEEFGGWEFGLSGRYTVTDPLFVSAGVLLHSNEGGDLGNQEVILYAPILMMHAGLGVNIFDPVLIQVDYFIPASTKAIYKTLEYPMNSGNFWQPYNLKNMLRVSILIVLFNLGE